MLLCLLPTFLPGLRLKLKQIVDSQVMLGKNFRVNRRLSLLEEARSLLASIDALSLGDDCWAVWFDWLFLL